MTPENLATIRKRIELLEDGYGSGRATARALGVDHVMLWRIKHGKKVPSDKMMEKLGLRWEVKRAPHE